MKPADLPAAWRLPLLVAAVLTLLATVAGGLVRIGVELPALPPPAAIAGHGTLLITGFFATVIALERAVAIGRRWAYLGPLGTASGALGILAGWAPAVWASLAGGLVLVAASAFAYSRQRAAHTAVLLGGAALLPFALALALAGTPAAVLVPWWFSFLILTIAGERLELSRLAPRPPWAGPVLAAVLVLLGGGLLGLLYRADVGARLFGLSLLALAGWLIQCDLARRTVRLPGLPRFVASCLLSGYAWLAVAGLVYLGGPLPPAGAWRHDAAIHALGLGFVFAMVFGHAPIIVPAVSGRTVAFSRLFYLPLVLLQFGLLLRLGGGLAEVPTVRAAGGAVNALTLAVFIVLLLRGLALGRSRRPAGLQAPSRPLP